MAFAINMWVSYLIVVMALCQMLVLYPVDDSLSLEFYDIVEGSLPNEFYYIVDGSLPHIYLVDIVMVHGLLHAHVGRTSACN